MPAQTGRLMVKTQRQSKVVNRPPRGWPTSPATAPPTAHTPSALARRAGSGKVSRTSDIEAGSMIAAPAPWAQRAAISRPVVGGERAGRRGQPEDDDAEGHRPLRADPVGQVAGEQQQRGEQQRVAVDHPLLADRATAELGPDPGQGDVDDRDVQRDQEEAHRGDGDHDPRMRPVGVGPP